MKDHSDENNAGSPLIDTGVNPENSSEYLLEVKGISKAFPGVQALEHIDLKLRVGEVLAIVGENGAGKSTMMKILSGIYIPRQR